MHPSTGEFLRFPCDHFLSNRMDGGKLERRLEVDTSAEQAEEAEVEYRVTVFTADERNAGTDADVHLTLVGTSGRVGPLRLGTPISSLDPFEVRVCQPHGSRGAYDGTWLYCWLYWVYFG